MAKEKINFPSKVDKKPSFMERIMKMLNRTSQLIDANGNVKYISYPPKKGFSKKQINTAETLVVNDVLIFGENGDKSFRQLVNLKKLVLGSGVLGIADGALTYSTIRELELSEDVKMIPEGAIEKSSIKKVTSPNFNLSTSTKNTTTDIYIDQDDRLHFLENAHVSLGQEDYILSHGKNLALETAAAAKSLAKQLLKSTSKQENTNSIFVYAEGLGTETDYSIHTITDEYPIKDTSLSEISDDKLVGILTNGVEEVSLESLSKYPNLSSIVVGKGVKRVVKGNTTEIASYKDEESKDVLEQRNPNGALQTISFTSSNTLVMSAPTIPNSGEVPQKVAEKEVNLEK